MHFSAAIQEESTCHYGPAASNAPPTMRIPLTGDVVHVNLPLVGAQLGIGILW